VRFARNEGLPFLLRLRCNCIPNSAVTPLTLTTGGFLAERGSAELSDRVLIVFFSCFLVNCMAGWLGKLFFFVSQPHDVFSHHPSNPTLLVCSTG
jgi:hypothetical protein